jgi:hypothetical protein
MPERAVARAVSDARNTSTNNFGEATQTDKRLTQTENCKIAFSFLSVQIRFCRFTKLLVPAGAAIANMNRDRAR